MLSENYLIPVSQIAFFVYMYDICCCQPDIITAQSYDIWKYITLMAIRNMLL